VLVKSLKSDETLYALNARKLMMPASNMKIVTLAGAVHTLGWERRFTTTLETPAPIDSGVLRGDLFVRGGGDPTINTRNGRGASVFAEWARVLKAAGIEAITGRIIGDDQLFDDEGIGGGWAWDYLQYGYAAPVGALQYNEDTAELTIAPAAVAGEPAVVTLAPGSGLTLSNRTVTGASDARDTIDYRRYLHQPILEVTGIIPAGAKPLTRQVAVVNPTVFFAQSLKDALIAAGIRITGDAVDYDDVASEAGIGPPAGRRVLAQAESPPLRDIASVLMKVSQNLYAETFLKAAGAAAGGAGTTETGRAALRASRVEDRRPVARDGRRLGTVAIQLRHRRPRDEHPGTHVRGPHSSRRLHSDTPRCRPRRDRVDTPATHARGRQCARENRVDCERAVALRVCQNARR
jgi:D-alanyl-D-alanine carboxypeptidase/D-alanyl-D-alanine-endopeptidase (penicillin-binding protein 4)